MSDYVDAKVTNTGGLMYVQRTDTDDYEFGYVGADETPWVVEAADLHTLETLVASALFDRDSDDEGVQA